MDLLIGICTYIFYQQITDQVVITTDITTDNGRRCVLLTLPFYKLPDSVRRMVLLIFILTNNNNSIIATKL